MRRQNQDQQDEDTDDDSSMDEDEAEEEETETTSKSPSGDNAERGDTTSEDCNGNVEEEKRVSDNVESVEENIAEAAEEMVSRSKTPITVQGPEEKYSQEISKKDETILKTGTTTHSDKDKSNSDDSDLEDLSNLNRSHRPYRDTTDLLPSDVTMDDDTQSVASSSFDPAEVRKRVKRSLVKKQQAARRQKKGEAGAVTRARRERKDDVNQSVSALDSGW